MRDIKFRVWDNVDYMSKPFTLLDVQRRLTQFAHDCTVMQYTGLKDSNGTDIYEGDIVYLAGQGDELMEFPFMELYQAYAESDIGVIKGNIYENPELIGAIA